MYVIWSCLRLRLQIISKLGGFEGNLSGLGYLNILHDCEADVARCFVFILGLVLGMRHLTYSSCYRLFHGITSADGQARGTLCFYIIMPFHKSFDQCLFR